MRRKQIHPAIAKAAVSYDLHSLGWRAFQQLCLTILREILGQTVSAFLDGRDGGRDGGFRGKWKPQKHEDISGTFVFQCKFTNRAGYNLALADVSDEVEKAARLVKDGICENYFLLTNAGVSGVVEQECRSAFTAVGVRYFNVFGYTWICDTIRDNKRLRMLVPRVYGLGDLSQILDERSYAQARALLDSLQDDLSKVVLTGTYYRAAKMLEKYGFVLLIGEPAAGKSTIAATLAMAAIDQWGCSTLKIDEPAGIKEDWNPHEPSQFFWIDDAFGVTQYEIVLAYGWNRAFPRVKAALANGARVVMTSRDYIYNRARNDLKQDAFPLFKEAQVVIDVHDLTLEERREILYNHLKLGAQPREFKTDIKPYLDGIALNPKFIPEIARRLAHPLFTSNLSINPDEIADFVERPKQFLLDVIQALDRHSKAALALIHMNGGMLASPLQLTPAETDALGRLGSALPDCTVALSALKDSLVQYVVRDGVGGWIFKHPTIGDAFADMILGDPELMGIYLRGTAVDQLVDQVTCGDVGLTGAVEVPEHYFPVVLERLLRLPSNWENQRLVDFFLSYRAGPAFLKLFLSQSPELLKRVVEPGLYLSAVSEVPLAIRLYKLGMLSEEQRSAFAGTVMNYAIEGRDAYVLENADLRAMLTETEFADLRLKLRTVTIPKLEELRLEQQLDHSHGDDPWQHMSPFLDALKEFEKLFRRSKRVVRRIKNTRKQVREWISQREPPDSDDLPTRALSRPAATVPTTSAERSIFDDVDE